MRRTDPDDFEALLRALPGSEFDAPQGRVRVDEHNHHTWLRPRIGRARADGQFDIVEEARAWVRPDPYLVSHTLEDWSVRVKLESA
jgi:branched-chain amino acid transport system substrate-binding protein